MMKDAIAQMPRSTVTRYPRRCDGKYSSNWKSRSLVRFMLNTRRAAAAVIAAYRNTPTTTHTYACTHGNHAYVAKTAWHDFGVWDTGGTCVERMRSANQSCASQRCVTPAVVCQARIHGFHVYPTNAHGRLERP